MSKNGKRKVLMSQIRKMFPSHEFFYPNECKESLRSKRYDLLPIPR